MALAHEKVGHTGQGLWHHKGMQLPAFIQHVANDLMQTRGMPESQAVQMAIGVCQRWARGGGDVTAETKAKAAAAIAEWERLKARAKVTRSEPMSSGYDEDGLDASWDGPLDDLPDLAGLDVGDLEAADPGHGDGGLARAAKLGTGARFKALKAKLAAKGASDPGALAAFIGRKKYGRKKFAALAAKTRKSGTKAGVSRGIVTRVCPLEDIHIVTRAQGDGSGRVVEAYAAVFGQPVGISDGQGHYEEVIHRGAFDETLARLQRMTGGIRRVKVLYNHGKTLEGQPAPEYQRPIATPLEITPDSRGLLTRSEYKQTPLAEEILEDIKAGNYTGQSFEGPDLRSDPPLRGPGDRYRRRSGQLQRVTRMALGLLNYGPALYEAYPGAEFLGVRMTVIGDDTDGYTGDEDDVPGVDEDVTGDTPEEVIPSRSSYQNRLYRMNAEEALVRAGIVLPRRQE